MPLPCNLYLVALNITKADNIVRKTVIALEHVHFLQTKKKVENFPSFLNVNEYRRK